jgi:hypothetical protein
MLDRVMKGNPNVPDPAANQLKMMMASGALLYSKTEEQFIGKLKLFLVFLFVT